MTSWSRLRALARRMRRSAVWERALDDELSAWLDQDIEARIERGMSPAEARRTALADFGGVEQVKEQVRAGVTGAWLDGLQHDVGRACRALARSRGFAAWVIGSLATGMAVTIAALAFLNALNRPFPGVTAQPRLVRVSVSRNCGRADCWTRLSSPADYVTLRDSLTGLQGLAAYTIGDLAVAIPEPQSMRGALTSANYFDVLGVRTALGRSFDATDDRTQAAVAVIAHSVWTRELGADPAVIGRSIRVANEIVQIVGVAPPFFVGIDLSPGARAPDVWLPIWLADRVAPLSVGERRRRQRDINFVGRLADGVEAEQIRAEAEVVSRQLAISPGPGPADGAAEVREVTRVRRENRHLAELLLMPIPILVLAIACVNAANLMLARGSQRRREIAICLAIGAGRGRIIRQLLIESAILASVASAIAVPIAWWGLHVASNPLGVPIPFDATVLMLTMATAAGTTVAFGLAPAIRTTAQQPSSALGPVGARSDAVPAQSRLRRGLVVAQVALSLGLLATAWQLVATVRSQAVSGGTPGDRLLVARFNLRLLMRPAAEAEIFYRRLLDAAARLPGVEAAGLARDTPGGTYGRAAAPASVVVWQPADRLDEGRVTIGGYAGGDLFDALGLHIVQGRGFTETDRRARPTVAIVNQAFARTMTGPALGSLLQIAPPEQEPGSSLDVRIVGILESASEPRYAGDQAPVPKLYVPSPIEPEPALALHLRSATTAAALAQPVRDLVNRIEPNLPILELGSLDQINERAAGPQLWLARAAAFLGVIGLLLATAGLYGVSSYVVAMRSREIAIRMAVGARPEVILRMVLNQSMRMALIGLLVGGAAAIGVSRVIQAGYHGLVGIDGRAFGGAAALFLTAMLLASAVPAVRASRLDPVENLKDV